MNIQVLQNASKTELYLTGTTAYIREFDICTHSKKSEFEKLLNNRDNAIVHLDKSTYKKYADKINKLGYVFKETIDYNSYENLCYIEKEKIQDIKTQIQNTQNDINYLFDKFTRAAHSRSGSILKQMMTKESELKRLKEKLSL